MDGQVVRWPIMEAYFQQLFAGFCRFWPVLGPETRPDGPGLSRDSDFRPENSKRTRPDQFRPTFGPWPKMPPAKMPTFAL